MTLVEVRHKGKTIRVIKRKTDLISFPNGICYAGWVDETCTQFNMTPDEIIRWLGHILEDLS
jgi:hypothetical protein